MGRRGYPAEFRRRVLDLVAAGRRVAEVAQDLGITEQTIYNWRRQDRIDRGLDAGLSTAERGELAAARKRIRELEAELAVHRRATELLPRIGTACAPSSTTRLAETIGKRIGTRIRGLLRGP